jgi:hypothetical protein
VGATYEQREWRCPNAECDWTDFEPIDALDGTFMCGQCAFTFPLQTFETRIIERDTIN